MAAAAGRPAVRRDGDGLFQQPPPVAPAPVLGRPVRRRAAGDRRGPGRRTGCAGECRAAHMAAGGPPDLPRICRAGGQRGADGAADGGRRPLGCVERPLRPAPPLSASVPDGAAAGGGSRGAGARRAPVVDGAGGTDAAAFVPSGLHRQGRCRPARLVPRRRRDTAGGHGAGGLERRRRPSRMAGRWQDCRPCRRGCPALRG